MLGHVCIRRGMYWRGYVLEGGEFDGGKTGEMICWYAYAMYYEGNGF